MPFQPMPPSPMARRELLRRSTALALAAMASPITSRIARGKTRFLDYPFKLGIASGNPIADGVVLWTRIAPAPLDGGGMPGSAVPVEWSVASDEGMTDVVREGTALAAPEHAYSVHVPVRGLRPDRWYFYRFTAGDEESPIGRTRTFPVIGAPKQRMRFAFGSCQHFNQGYFTAYRQMVEDDLDLILTLGDYIYESTWGRQVRWHLPEPHSLADYPATRQRIIDHIADRKIENAVFIGGDIHQFWTSDVKRDFNRPESPTVATEFIGGSITSESGPWAEKHVADNPHIRFHDWANRGYGRAELSKTGMKMDFVAMEDVANPNGKASVLKSFNVEAGRAGVTDA